ncbi:MAG: hypothetical protein J3K34DRAFT_527267, partial [Monoraphidium minutum]
MSSPALLAALKSASSLQQLADVVASLRAADALDARQLGVTFGRVAQLLAGFKDRNPIGDTGMHAEVKTAARVLRELEQPLQQQAGRINPSQGLAVLSAWARSRGYTPPAGLVAAVAE